MKYTKIFLLLLCCSCTKKEATQKCIVCQIATQDSIWGSGGQLKTMLQKADTLCDYRQQWLDSMKESVYDSSMKNKYGGTVTEVVKYQCH